MADGNNVLNYPQMARQREENIQANEIAYAEDVNAEFDYIMDTFNQLVAMLTGEWGDGTGRIYDLVDDAVSLANQALVAAQNCVQKTGDTMTGHLNIALVPASDYNVVNKKYVDDTIDAELAEPINRITTLENWKENLDATQIKLSNANFSGTNVNDGMNELFISVSNGKAIVAAAITGKGIETASDASFKTMADNINALLTFTEGTSGGTATAEDIMYGKTAYARNSLIIGSYIPLDTSDATATAADIRLGTIAYARGEKLYGTLIPQAGEGGPTFGTDTSDATATAADIAYGKTAYARGQKITGNMNSSLEEIYGISSEPFDADMMSFATNDPPDGASAIDKIQGLCFSQDGNYCVRWGTTKDNTKVVESFAINENGLYYHATKGATTENITYKKYRYTWEELGLVSSDGTVASSIIDIAFGCGGFNSYSWKGTLAIIYEAKVADETHRYLKFITYHLTNEGIIGTAYDNEDIVDFSVDITSDKYSKIAGDLNNPDVFFAFYIDSGYGLDRLTISPTLNGTTIQYYIRKSTCDEKLNLDSRRITAIELHFTEDSKYCYLMSRTDDYRSGLVCIWNISQNMPRSITLGGGTSSYPEIDNINTMNVINGITYAFSSRFGTFYVGETKSGGINNLYIDISTVRRIQLYNDSSYRVMYGGNVTADGKRLITLVYQSYKSGRYTYYNYKILVHNIAELLAVQAGNETAEYVAPVQTYDVPIQNSITSAISPCFRVFASRDTTKIYRTFPGIGKFYGVASLRTALDNQNIIGVKYKNQYFSKVQSQTFTATASDVRAGKTFIGYAGYPQTGTMEV